MIDLFPFDNSYQRLPKRFYARLDPTPVAGPRLIWLNRGLADELGLDADALAGADGVAALGGRRVPRGADPIAMAYAGHQFGGYSPRLGDGRALLLGEVVDRAGVRRDVQLKGSGPTPFSRRGDGRAAVGPMLREVVIGEALHALAIPTTRALAVVATGEPVYRDRALPGAVLTRIARSHVRVGTFQFFAAEGDREAIGLLVDHVVERHFPEIAGRSDRALALLDRVVAVQAELIAAWMSVGFIHGVMNTDNMQVAGESIDFGPCAWMDEYDPARVFSSIDHMGRYAFANQPAVAQWNLARLAEALLIAIAPDPRDAVPAATDVVETFSARFGDAFLRRMRAKLGLASTEPDDVRLIDGFMTAMAAGAADFTKTFRALAGATAPGDDAALLGLATDPAALAAWLPGWRARLKRDAMPPPIGRRRCARSIPR